VVDALRCATEVQPEMAERNPETAGTERIDYRMGVHQGNIVVESGDIFGDGVNVAGRLEGRPSRALRHKKHCFIWLRAGDISATTWETSIVSPAGNQGKISHSRQCWPGQAGPNSLTAQVADGRRTMLYVKQSLRAR
jgi:hypothetical protein